MFSGRLRPGIRFFILIVMGLLATAATGARAQDSTDDGQVPLGELFEQAFQAVAGVTDRVVIRLAAEVLSGDVSRVFHKMAGLVYDDNLSQSSAVWIMANALRKNGYHELGAQVVEVLRGKTNYPGYFIAAINERFE